MGATMTFLSNSLPQPKNHLSNKRGISSSVCSVPQSSCYQRNVAVCYISCQSSHQNHWKKKGSKETEAPLQRCTKETKREEAASNRSNWRASVRRSIGCIEWKRVVEYQRAHERRHTLATSTWHACCICGRLCHSNAELAAHLHQCKKKPSV